MLLDLAGAQAAHGDQVHVALLNDGLLARRLNEIGVPVYLFPESRLDAITLLRRIRRTCADLSPDVVHTHRMKENVLGALAARLSGVPVCIRTAHGDSEHAIRWFQIKKQIARAMERLSNRFLLDTTIAVSQELAGRLRRRWMHGGVEVVQNGIDAARIRRDSAEVIPELMADSSAVRVCFIGRLVPVKRVDLFVQACSVLARSSSRHVHAFVIGDGPLRAHLEALARGLPNLTCTFVGFVNNPASWLSHMNLMVITSDHEGLPMSLLEALAIGVRVVSRAVGGITELLIDGRHGRLVYSDEPDAIASAMSAEVRSVASGGGLARDAEFPVEMTAMSMASRYTRIYQMALAKAGDRN